MLVFILLVIILHTFYWVGPFYPDKGVLVYSLQSQLITISNDISVLCSPSLFATQNKRRITDIAVDR